MNKTTQNDHDMFNHLENFGMLDAIQLDQSIFSLKHRVYTNRLELWRKFIRSI